MKKHQRNVKNALTLGLSSLALASFAVSAANEQTPLQRGPSSPFFASLDANHDGFLSRDEVRHRPGYEEAFDQADDDGDARLGAEEFIKAESLYQRMKVADYVDDSVVTAKVKTAIVKDLKTIGIGVETYRGQVLLSGFVDNGDQADRAVRVASSIDGVTSVKNGLAVKK
jgi:hyperosmotically inducible protein